MHVGLVLGSFEGEVLTDFTDQHVALVGPTGSGKDLSTVLPWCATWPGSMIVCDPKDGDTYRRTQRWRRTFSHVYRYAPKWQDSDDLNVLDIIRLGGPDEFLDTDFIAGSLTAPRHLARETQASMHFGDMAKTLLTGAILHVLYTSARKSLPGVLDFCVGFNGDLEGLIKILVDSKHLNGQAHDVIAGIGREIGYVKDRELSSIWSTMMRGLHLYRDHDIARHSDRTTVPLDRLQSGAKPSTVYLIAPSPQQLDALHPLFRVVMEILVQVTMRQRVRTQRHPVLVAWNEFPSFGWVRSVESDIATLREYGWRLALIVQDLHQLWKTYGEDTAIWGNVPIKLFHAPAHDLTAKRVCENLIGWRTVERDVVSRAPYKWLRSETSVSTQQSKELLLQPSEFTQMDPDDMVLIISGRKLPPVQCQKLWYDRYKTLKGRIDH